MRSFLTLFILVLTLLFSFFSPKAQTISNKTEKPNRPKIKPGHFKYNDWDANNLAGRVRYIKEIFRQADGSDSGRFEEMYVVREMHFDIQGYLQTESECVQLPSTAYQDDGTITKEKLLLLYSGCSKSEYNYDLIKKVMTVNHFLKGLAKTAYESDGKSITKYFENGYRREYLRYDRDGKTIARDTTERMPNGKTIYAFYADDTLIQRQITYTDSDGNWVSEDSDGKTVTKSRNDNGMISETFRDGKTVAATFEKRSPDGRFEVEGKCDCSWGHYRIEYEFDQNKNATKIVKQKIVVKNGETSYQPLQSATREIVYYK